MDPDTSKKVDDLLGLVDGISNEIDVKAELKRINGRIDGLEKRLEEVLGRLAGLELAQRDRQKMIERIKKDLKGIL
jgi:predicted  nucleic acid-binding Zn-ribbon protein